MSGGIGGAEVFGNAHLGVKFNWAMPSGNYYVVDTDYENYTVVYSCTSLWLFHIEYAWLLVGSRDMDYDKLIA